MQLISIGQFHKVIEKYLYWLSLPSIGFTDILEIIIISVIVYQMLKWVQLTRAWTLFKGIIMLLLFALFVLLKFDVFKLIACFAGVIIKIIERLIENYKYFKISSEIDGAAKVIEINPSKEQLDELQRMINQRREYIVLEMNFYHKKIASELSKRYRDILMNK